MANLQTIGGDITAKPLNDNFNAINNEVVAFTSNANTQTATIQRGLQNIYSDQTTPAHLKKLLGRTLVNHMGRQGGFYSQFNRWGANMVINSDNTGRIDNSTGTTTKSSQNSQKNYVSGKYILLGVWAKAVSGTPKINVFQFGYDSAGTRTTIAGTGEKIIDTTWKFYYIKLDLTAKTDAYWQNRLDVVSFGTANDVVDFKKMLVYELTSAEFSYAHTQAEIEEKYAYANSVKPIKHPYIVAYGKNMLPPFTEWEDVTSGKGEIVEPYKVKINPQGFYYYRIYVPVVEGEIYTPSGTKDGGSIYFYFTDGNKTRLTSVITSSATAPSGAKLAEVIVNSDNLTTAVTFTNPMLNLGSTALPFEPANNDYAYIQGSFHSNLDGTVADVLTQVSATEWDVVRKFKDVVLDGTLGWVYSADYAGFKRITTPNPSGIITGIVGHRLVKYDGKILFENVTWDGGDKFVSSSDGNLHVTIADTDTGWNESVNPTAGEMQAYFYGWKMYTSGTTITDTSTWDGVGTKAWAYKNKDGVWVDGTTTLPTSAPNNASQTPLWSRYTLTYQLANEVSEPVVVEGALNFHQDDNQVEFGEGVIVKEPANPVKGTTTYQINYNPFPSSNLKNRADKIIRVYKNGKTDTKWVIQTHPDAYGNQRAYINEADFDPTTQYTVTSILLDKHEHTVNVVESELSYNTNLKTVVDQLVVDQTDTQAEVDAIQWDIDKRLLKGEGERVESGNNNVTVTAGATASVTVTFKKAFTVKPKVKPQIISGRPDLYFAAPSAITTTGFTLNASNKNTIEFTVPVEWTAIGK
jgi:hypothetical protein